MAPGAKTGTIKPTKLMIKKSSPSQAFPIKGRKKFVAPIAKATNDSAMDDIWKKKLGLDQTEPPVQKNYGKPQESIYGNQRLQQDREEEMRKQMFGGANMPQQSQVEDDEDSGQQIMQMLAERRKKQQEQ